MTPLLTATDIADRLQISRGYAYELMRRMHHVIIGRSIRVRPEVLQQWLTRFENRALAGTSTLSPGTALAGDEAYVMAFLRRESEHL